MKAKEMFEELGYKLNEDSDDILSYYTLIGWADVKCIIGFHKIKHIITKYYEQVPLHYAWVNKSELEAINKQVEELGWEDGK